ncbi:MAG: ABC transporter permease [Acidobacteria bacterium]|nr:ABC transporter permease [Acidobacteriota bacterium]
MSWATWQALRDLPAFQDVGAWTRESVVLDRPSRAIVETWKVSASVLPLLGVKPVIGRLFTADEDTTDPDGAALISWDFWQARFGGREDVVGQTLGLTYTYLDHHVRTVVGVLPQSVAMQGQIPEVVLPWVYRHGRAWTARRSGWWPALSRRMPLTRRDRALRSSCRS